MKFLQLPIVWHQYWNANKLVKIKLITKWNKPQRHFCLFLFYTTIYITLFCITEIKYLIRANASPS